MLRRGFEDAMKETEITCFCMDALLIVVAAILVHAALTTCDSKTVFLAVGAAMGAFALCTVQFIVCFVRSIWSSCKLKSGKETVVENER